MNARLKHRWFGPQLGSFLFGFVIHGTMRHLECLLLDRMKLDDAASAVTAVTADVRHTRDILAPTLLRCVVSGPRTVTPSDSGPAARQQGQNSNSRQRRPTWPVEQQQQFYPFLFKN